MKQPRRSKLTLFMFSPLWGLPTHSPFSLKLATWLRLAELDHETVLEDDPRKGPKKKCPWVEFDGEAMGDSELIIARLSERYAVDPDAWLTPTQRAIGLTLRRTFEEHFIQYYEHAFFVTDEGWPHASVHFNFLPALLRPLVLPMIRSDFKKEAWIKGLGRHSPEDMARLAQHDLDAAAVLLGDKPYVFGDRPTLTDCSLYGFLGLVLWAPIPCSAQTHLKSLPNLLAFCQRMRERFWPDERAESRAA